MAQLKSYKFVDLEKSSNKNKQNSNSENKEFESEFCEDQIAQIDIKDEDEIEIDLGDADSRIQVDEKDQTTRISINTNLNNSNQTQLLDQTTITSAPKNNSTILVVTNNRQTTTTKPLPLSPLAITHNNSSQSLPLGSPIIQNFATSEQNNTTNSNNNNNALFSIGSPTPSFQSSKINNLFNLTTNEQQQTKHFEIRWRNINLKSQKSIQFATCLSSWNILKSFSNKQQTSSYSTSSSPIEDEKNKNKFELNQRQTNNLSNQTKTQKSNTKIILQNVSGSVFSGQMTAILGPSGVGKTTLLNSLTGRNTLDGSGFVKVLGGASKRMSVLTIPQSDVLPTQLTTLEDLQFTSRIKNPQKNFNHDANIAKTVKLLQMTKFLNTRINKLSGGEARRLSIGRELLSSPDIMILDEPTSGLDANTCRKIISALRDIVEHSENILDKPICMLVTIHQPQQEVINLFHRCYVMAIGGRTIYEGPASNIMPTLLEHSSISKLRPLEELNENPAVVMIEVASGEFGPEVIEELNNLHINQMAFPYFDYSNDDNSPLQTPRTIHTPSSVSRHKFGKLVAQRAALQSIASTPKMLPMNKTLARNLSLAQISTDQNSTITAMSYDNELPIQNSKLKVDKRLRRSVIMRGDFKSHSFTLMKRCWLLNIRNRLLMFIRLIGFLLIASGIVNIFSGPLDPQEHGCPMYETEIEDVSNYLIETRDRLKRIPEILEQGASTHLLFFQLMLSISMVTSALSGLVYPLQVRMFQREFKNGWYSFASFLTSQTLAEFPIDVLGPIICVLIVYPLCGQPASAYHWRELAYLFILTLIALICKSQAQIIGAILANSVENSVFLSCVMVAPPALLSGINVRLMKAYYPVQLVSYISFLRYSFESLFIIRYGYNMCPCDSELVRGYPTSLSSAAMPPRLELFAHGLIDLNQPSTINDTILILKDSSTGDQTEPQDQQFIQSSDNLFQSLVQLLTSGKNLFLQRDSELGNCSSYKSLYLIDYELSDYLLPRWIFALVLIFIISRILTYYVVKAVIRFGLVRN